ncbi:hypothetical protein PK98_09685 [Croceibacterium mercuriale]|uniref:Uncharacterized protein n=1 Tax=Croceibacterium mercuriale TaxID=1572751 RepID=A0A0B2BSF3_9SPHN|nr:hypothetical protein [Croceibacterium mercuriale]KHL24349.1 hypothetical protein PK98_09685 [Croceibacterium mercuriale]
MSSFTELETAVLGTIFAETPTLAPGLRRQLTRATVTKRVDTEHGFFTDIAVPSDVPPVDAPDVLGHSTHAHVAGVEHGFGFVLFMNEGRLHLLEGYAFGPDVASLDLYNLSFEVYCSPINCTE